MGKNKKDNETLYEKTMRQLKNNPIVVAVLVIGAIAVGLSQGLDIFNKFKDTVSPAEAKITEINLSVQRFNAAGEYDGAPFLRSPILKDPTDMNSVATDIVGAITDEIQPAQNPSFKVNLAINGNILTSDAAIGANLIAVKVDNPVMQQGPRIQATDLVAGEDISQRFADAAFFGADCRCITFELNAPVTGYQSDSLKVFQLQDGYSLDANQPVSTKTVVLNAAFVSLLIEFPEGAGAEEQDLSATAARLDGAIRQKIQEIDFITISPYKSQAEYQAEIEKAISALPLGGGKEDYLEQHGVDFIVTITFVMK